MPEHSKPLPKSQRERGLILVYWLIVSPTIFFLGFAVYCSWPLGPEYVDEGGITKLRLALALIAGVLIWVILSLLGFLLLIIRWLDDIATRLAQVAEEHKKTSETNTA